MPAGSAYDVRSVATALPGVLYDRAQAAGIGADAIDHPQRSSRRLPVERQRLRMLEGIDRVRSGLVVGGRGVGVDPQHFPVVRGEACRDAAVGRAVERDVQLSVWPHTQRTACAGDRRIRPIEQHRALGEHAVHVAESRERELESVARRVHGVERIRQPVLAELRIECDREQASFTARDVLRKIERRGVNERTVSNHAHGAAALGDEDRPIGGECKI